MRSYLHLHIKDSSLLLNFFFNYSHGLIQNRQPFSSLQRCGSHHVTRRSYQINLSYCRDWGKKKKDKKANSVTKAKKEILKEKWATLFWMYNSQKKHFPIRKTLSRSTNNLDWNSRQESAQPVWFPISASVISTQYLYLDKY